MRKLSIVIPCYNSENSLSELIERIDISLNDKYDYEIICVNDCSKDRTIDVLTDLTTQYAALKVIDLVFNVGQFKALLCAMENATGDVVVTLDDDLQHRPEDIPLLVEYLCNNAHLDVVIGAYKEKKHKTYRNAGTMLRWWIDKKIFNKPENLKTSSFRAIKKVLVEALVAHKTNFPVIGPLILSLTKNIENVEVEHCERKYGKSNYKLSKLISTTFDNVLNFSSLPLKCISVFGVIVSIISFLISIFYLLKYFFGGIGVPGWTTLIVLINFYFGLVLLSIGLIGEYLIRILKESNGAPRYAIRKKINFNE